MIGFATRERRTYLLYHMILSSDFPKIVNESLPIFLDSVVRIITMPPNFDRLSLQQIGSGASAVAVSTVAIGKPS